MPGGRGGAPQINERGQTTESIDKLSTLGSYSCEPYFLGICVRVLFTEVLFMTLFQIENPLTM